MIKQNYLNIKKHFKHNKNKFVFDCFELKIYIHSLIGNI